MAVGVSRGFHDPGPITRALGVALVVLMALEAAALVAGLFDYLLLNRIEGGTPTPAIMMAIADAGAHYHRVVATAFRGTFIAATIVFTRWIYVLNDNKRRLKAHGLRFSPGWAVGWFLVPVATLWMPYRAMRELWRVSADPSRWRAERIPWILPAWWCLWIGTLVLGQITDVRGSIAGTMLARQWTETADILKPFILRPTLTDTVLELRLANLLNNAGVTRLSATPAACLALVRRIAAMQRDRITDVRSLKALA